ncbi:Metal-nicotianamine transporter YSL3 [Linum grandiflorum]
MLGIRENDRPEGEAIDSDDEEAVVVAGEAMEEEEEDVKRVEPWTQQITVRGIVASIVIGIIYSVIVMKLNLTTGIIPTMNISAALLGFVFVKAWTKLLKRVGFATKPFTRQENTLIQTCAVACYSISLAGGFGSYLLGLNKKTYEQAGGGTLLGNNPGSVKEPGIGWMTGFLFVSCFVGLLALVPLRKIMIIDYKLPYPSGTATAVLINGFHTNKGNKIAKKQVRGFARFFSLSFVWAFFQWFYTGGDKCGFLQFPTFGLLARDHSFFFDFSSTYIGAGMICSHLVNLSLLFGAVLSYGIMWPLIARRGDWFPPNLPASSMKGPYGYKVFISIAMILGDGLYNFLKILYLTAVSIFESARARKNVRTQSEDAPPSNDLRRNEAFVRETIPLWIACAGYIAFSVISIIIIPLMFPQLKWYYVVVAYLLAPALSFCNAYGTGLTDMNMAYNYGKVALFILAALTGKEHGVVAGLVGCGLIKSIVSMSSDLMQDMKTAFNLGDPNGVYKAPYALVYRNMAILGVEGFSALPKHCLQLSYAWFLFAVVTNLLRDVVPKKVSRFIPLPMAMAVPFLIGASSTVDMCVGSLVVFVWQKMDVRKARLMVPAVASGLICGDGLWILPSSLLALAEVKPPICMSFSKGV